MEDLEEALRRIEQRLDTGTYRPGEWATFVRVAARRSRPEHLRIADHVSRFSEKLHLRRGWRTFSFSTGIAAEAIGAAIGAVLLVAGMTWLSGSLVLTAAIILGMTRQPLVKIAAGCVLGIRYSYTFLWHIESRFKMRYGTYLSLPRWRRVLFQLSGTVGTPLAFGLVSLLAAPKLQAIASMCAALFSLAVSIQVIPFLAGLAGARRFGLGSLARVTSARVAAMEVREGCLPGKR